MHFSPKFNFTIRHCSHYSSLRKLPKLRKIPNYHRPQAILQAQQALIEYLYCARSLPFTHAENISNNSLFSLSELISKVEFSPQNFSRSFPRFLRYHPIDKFDFFFESIGIPYWEIKEGLGKDKIKKRTQGYNGEVKFLAWHWFRTESSYDKGLIRLAWLCKIVYCRVKALNQNHAMLEEKVNYLQFGLGCSLQYLDVYPGFLCFNLENRIKPRCAIHQWLFEKGLVRRKYRITSMISPSEKTIIARLYNIHPKAIPKQWLENPSRFKQ
ncbi:hypothetical protein Syun_018502 [Stephania yunnanensis]|uniref:Uncharacterized protein n=1 Tax=Stephania yunnanensis TaxID=152371 RepID=A0AAP0ITG5_9MAGN